MTEDQVRQRLSEAVWNHFNKWAAKETCIISEDDKGHEVLEYLEGDVDKYLENLFLPHLEQKATATLTPKMIRHNVEFSREAPHAHSVTVAGDFNNWCPVHTPLRRDNDGVWRTNVSLPPGRHQYLFVVDGQWCSDPSAKESVINLHGGRNSVVEV